MPLLRAGFPALVVCLLLLLPQVHAFGAGSMYPLRELIVPFRHRCLANTNIRRHRFYLRRRREELAPWRH